MEKPNRRNRLPGMVLGSLIALSFGTVFVVVNSGGLSDPWPLVIRATAAAVAVALLAGLFRALRTAAAPAATARGTGFTDHRYWIIVGAEVIALFGGLAVINGIVERPAIAAAWVAVVVGVHFFGLAFAWRMPMFHWLGAAMTALGVAGFLVYAAGGGAAAVGLVSGVDSGFLLYAMVAVALRQTATGRTGARRTPVGGHAEPH